MARRLALISVAMVLVAVAFWTAAHRKRINSPSNATQSERLMSPGASSDSAATDAGQVPLAAGPEDSSATATTDTQGTQSVSSRPQEEMASIRAMSQTLADFARPERKLDDLVHFLKSSHQDPFLSKTANPYTGDLTIVRTNSPMVGTRYFHAQYFSDSHGEPIVQHMSFEIRPGADALSVARSAVASSFKNLGPPTVNNNGFVQWNLAGGYVVWIKTLGPNDLEGNPFNAYTPEDAGSVRVAVEKNPEGDEN